MSIKVFFNGSDTLKEHLLDAIIQAQYVQLKCVSIDPAASPMQGDSYVKTMH